MKKNYQITIPEFISIEKYQELTNLEHLSDIGKMVKTINVFTGIPEDEIKTWAIADMGKVAGDFSNKLDIKSQFYPIIKLNDVDYGYTDISTMSLGEFIDLEQLCKKPQANLHEIMAVLYRPVNAKIKDKYTIVPYKPTEGISEIMKEMPMDAVMSSLVFFYRLGIQLSKATLRYTEAQLTKTTNLHLKETLEKNGVGINQFMDSLKETYSDLTKLPQSLSISV